LGEELEGKEERRRESANLSKKKSLTAAWGTEEHLRVRSELGEIRGEADNRSRSNKSIEKRILERDQFPSSSVRDRPVKMQATVERHDEKRKNPLAISTQDNKRRIFILLGATGKLIINRNRPSVAQATKDKKGG